MPISSLPNSVLDAALSRCKIHSPDPGTAVFTLIDLWNTFHAGRASDADHLAVYFAMPDGSWKNTLREDLTVYDLALLGEGLSGARSGDTISEFRTLRVIDSCSASCPARARDEDGLFVKPCSARLWSAMSLLEAAKRLGRQVCRRQAFVNCAYRPGSRRVGPPPHGIRFGRRGPASQE